MEVRRLGGSELRVSAVGLGCWGFAGGSMWGPTDERQSIATIHAALDAGINLLDTAEGYGDGASERIVGRALEGRRDRAIVATKAGPASYSAAELRRSCEASLKRLRTDTIDLYQLHWPERQGAGYGEILDTLERLRGEGKIRAFGVCNFGVEELARLRPGAVSNQLAYSLVFRAIESAILPRCRELGLGVLVYSGLMHGLLSGRWRSADEVPEGRARTRHFAATRPGVRHGESGHEELTFATLERIRAIADGAGLPMSRLAVAWILAQPGVTSVLAGAREAEQATANAAVGDFHPGADVLDALSEASAELQRALGPNPDMWDAPGRIR